MLKALFVFYRTLYYLSISYRPGADVLALKRQWAEELLNYFGLQIEVKGAPFTGAPVILLGNHISYLDIIVLMYVHPSIIFLAKKEVSSWPVIGITAQRIGTLFVDRSAKDKSETRRKISQELIERKSHLVVFPSGTTTLYEEVPWKKGMFEISQEYKIPIQSFKVSYSHQRECAYIDEDNMLEQMTRLFSIRDKKVYFQWLKVFEVTDPVLSAEEVRAHVRSADFHNS